MTNDSKSPSLKPGDELNVAAIRAAAPGEVIPGRIATRNFIRLVTEIKAAAVIQASSQELPVGNNAPV